MLLLLCCAAEKATARGALSLPRSVLRGRRFLPPPHAETAFVSLRSAPPIARFSFPPVKIDDLLGAAVTSRCKTGKNKQLVTG